MKDRKPIIGVVSSYKVTDTWNQVFSYEEYLTSVREFGGIPLLIPTGAGEEELDTLLDLCVGLLLTGGNDVQPALYGEVVLNDTVKPAAQRDDTEWKLCDRVLERDMPVLAICRGMQFLNVYFGGTLYQDIPAQVDTQVKHSMDKPYIRHCHNCLVEPGTPLHDLLGRDSIGVNSHHHQSVKDLAPGFEIMGRCEDGIIEAMWRPEARFLWCVQWHPERIWPMDPNQGKIWEAFIAACRV